MYNISTKIEKAFFFLTFITEFIMNVPVEMKVTSRIPVFAQKKHVEYLISSAIMN